MYFNRTKAVLDVINERERQQSDENWSTEHDDEHTEGELLDAAVAYAVHVPKYQPRDSAWTQWWPWDKEWFKPKDKRSNLIRAAALIIAEIERLDRASAEKGAE